MRDPRGPHGHAEQLHRGRNTGEGKFITSLTPLWFKEDLPWVAPLPYWLSLSQERPPSWINSFMFRQVWNAQAREIAFPAESPQSHDQGHCIRRTYNEEEEGPRCRGDRHLSFYSIIFKAWSREPSHTPLVGGHCNALLKERCCPPD